MKSVFYFDTPARPGIPQAPMLAILFAIATVCKHQIAGTWNMDIGHAAENRSNLVDGYDSATAFLEQWRASTSRMNPSEVLL